MSRVLVFDPSGNFSDREGKGTTGWALFVDGDLTEFGKLEAEGFAGPEAYWYEHLLLMMREERKSITDFKVVCESYKLQPGKAMQQSWSELETPQLIGIMRMASWDKAYPFILQDPSIKSRFSDAILVDLGVVEKRGKSYYRDGRLLSLHERDAFRHGLYYLRYGVKS